jgi:hypothetical protein
MKRTMARALILGRLFTSMLWDQNISLRIWSVVFLLLRFNESRHYFTSLR